MLWLNSFQLLPEKGCTLYYYTIKRKVHLNYQMINQFGHYHKRVLPHISKFHKPCISRNLFFPFILVSFFKSQTRWDVEMPKFLLFKIHCEQAKTGLPGFVPQWDSIPSCCLPVIEGIPSCNGKVHLCPVPPLVGVVATLMDHSKRPMHWGSGLSHLWGGL